eukprot:CAMPEP_0171221046 /NCGR_PEP_ID=MMETSP0790-20130122/34552_1 /TAXON_ID=2925 /ORGANISM="Alexandrium catenella, Strain OF101" /LENGTH=40 /DNA_ID= /DNA_START= /DNA_END= /DNA_ORIENTATION=
MQVQVGGVRPEAGLQAEARKAAFSTALMPPSYQTGLWLAA